MSDSDFCVRGLIPGCSFDIRVIFWDVFVFQDTRTIVWSDGGWKPKGNRAFGGIPIRGTLNISWAPSKDTHPNAPKIHDDSMMIAQEVICFGQVYGRFRVGVGVCLGLVLGGFKRSAWFVLVLGCLLLKGWLQSTRDVCPYSALSGCAPAQRRRRDSGRASRSRLHMVGGVNDGTGISPQVRRRQMNTKC